LILSIIVVESANPIEIYSMLKPLRLDDNAPWKQRFRATIIASAQIARANPTRGLVTSTATGHYQLYAWDVPSNNLRQLTFRPQGTALGMISPDGRYVYYLEDKGGNEIGHFVRMNFEDGEMQDITPAMPQYSAFGISSDRAGNMLSSTISNNDGFHALIWGVNENGAFSLPRELYHSQRMMFGPILSYSGELGVMMVPKPLEFQYYSLKAFDLSKGKVVNDINDDEAGIMASSFSPVKGDLHLLATSTKTGNSRPFIWDPVSNIRTELNLNEIPGDVGVMDWSPDGKRILLSNSHRAIQQLYVYELPHGKLRKLDHPDGFYGVGTGFMLDAIITTDHEIIAGWQDSTHPPQLIALDSRMGKKTRTVLSAGEVPPGKPWKNITFKSTDGEIIQGWLALPDGKGPFPTILHMHGGPETATVEYFMPNSQAWVDHGFAWLAINYRGSTGFGRAFREKIWGDLGHWEIEDMVAARDWLVSEGIADPKEILLTGWSYGGYLTLLALGKRPDLWAGGMAGTATVDWAMEYEHLSPMMRGYSVAIMGGTPEEKPERYAKSSPINYIESIKAPALIIQGRNDTRTPARPVEVYEARMKAMGKQIEVHWYDEGHMGGGTEQDIEQMELMLKFAYRVLGG
jgi:dienelactone hydrolase